MCPLKSRLNTPFLLEIFIGGEKMSQQTNGKDEEFFSVMETFAPKMGRRI